MLEVGMRLSFKYLAGLFDGEGCITIDYRFNGRKKYHSLSVSITNTSLPTLIQIKDKIGSGHIQHCRNLVYVWRIHAHKAYEFLKNLLPHLIIKKEEAVIAIDFQTKIIEKGIGRNRVNNFKQRKLYRKQLQELKRRRYHGLKKYNN